MRECRAEGVDGHGPKKKKKKKKRRSGKWKVSLICVLKLKAVAGGGVIPSEEAVTNFTH